MRSSINGAGGKLWLALALAVVAMGSAAASASATLPELEYTLPDSAVFSGGQMLFEGGTYGTSVKCGTVNGPFALDGSAKQFVAEMVLKSCSVNFFGVIEKCSSAGAASGEIVTKVINVRLEYLSKATREVALIFNSGGKSSTIATFKCGSGEGLIRGEVLARITPVGAWTAKPSVVFNGAKGTQEFTQYENEKGEKITVSPLELVFEGLAEKSSLNSTGLSLLLTKEAIIKA